MALIEIDGLPFLKMGGSFHGYVTNNQRVYKNYIIIYYVDLYVYICMNTCISV